MRPPKTSNSIKLELEREVLRRLSHLRNNRISEDWVAGELLSIPIIDALIKLLEKANWDFGNLVALNTDSEVVMPKAILDILVNKMWEEAKGYVKG